MGFATNIKLNRRRIPLFAYDTHCSSINIFSCNCCCCIFNFQISKRYFYINGTKCTLRLYCLSKIREKKRYFEAFYLELFTILTSNILNYAVNSDNVMYLQRFPEEFYYSADLPNSFSDYFEILESVEPCLPYFTVLEYSGTPYVRFEIHDETMCDEEEKGGIDYRDVAWYIDTASYLDNDFLQRCLRAKRPGRGKFFLRFKKSDCVWYGRKFKFKKNSAVTQ